MGFPNKSFDFFFFFHCCLVLLFVFVLPICSISQPYKNITLGSSLTATAHNNNDPSASYWSSQSGDFAFGFRQLGTTDDFLLAIWFDKIVDKTITWSANRDSLVPTGSTVQLNSFGHLVLNDPGGKQIWATNSAGANQFVSYAALLDTGNFILATSDSQIAWQSFDEPTDTILPSQNLIQNKQLVARYSQTNYSTGRFQLSIKSDGDLNFYPRPFIDQDATTTTTHVYWKSDTQGSAFNLLFNLSGSIDLIAQNDTILLSLTSNNPPTQEFYHRAILEHDGVFRHYVYPKFNSRSNSIWPQDWSHVSDSIPSNICVAFQTEVGSGVCGFNGICRLGDDDHRPFCTCLPAHDLIDPNDSLKGCKPTFVSQSCNESFPETDDFEFVDLPNTDFPLDDHSRFRPVTEDWCKRRCLSDCFCVVAIFRNGACWKKKFPLSNGVMDSNITGKALVKIRKQNFAFKDTNHEHRNITTIIIIGSVLLGSSVFLNFLLLLLTLLICYRFNKSKSKAVLQGDPLILGVNLRIFGYEELNKATSGFIEKLGRGSFATVYKGVIIGSANKDNNFVAVKKLDNVVQQGDQEFKAEVSAIARTNHKNLVRLLGFCNEGDHRMLVYEFMRNGSLADFLFGASKPNWYDRIPLVLGTARGLSYLHEECGTQIIHCDIKPQNILLDHSFTARIADFGLAKLLKQDQTRTLTAIRGTKGYVAPEWFRSLPITVKVDVYSFGILLLEIICCRRSFEENVEDEGEMVLADWAYDCFKERKVEMLVENDKEAKTDLKRVKKFVMVAIWCIQEEPSLRPTMKKVVQMLEGAIEVSFPPDPSSFINAIS